MNENDSSVINVTFPMILLWYPYDSGLMPLLFSIPHLFPWNTQNILPIFRNDSPDILLRFLSDTSEIPRWCYSPVYKYRLVRPIISNLVMLEKQPEFPNGITGYRYRETSGRLRVANHRGWFALMAKHWLWLFGLNKGASVKYAISHHKYLELQFYLFWFSYSI